MIVTHLVCGLVLGSGAGLASWVSGAPAWTVLLAYCLAVSLGMLASALAASLFPSDDAGSTGWLPEEAALSGNEYGSFGVTSDARAQAQMDEPTVPPPARPHDEVGSAA